MKHSFSLCFMLIASTLARNVPYYDLDEIGSDELKNILSQHIQAKPSFRLGRPLEVKGWGLNVPLGQVTGVSTDLENRPVILHRGSRYWHQGSFNWTHHFQEKNAISEEVILTLDPTSGKILEAWGEDLFHLPHGITVDHEGNVWITDVGLHQVFKFEKGSRKPSLTLGERMTPGSDKTKFCQPTNVAVAKSGEIFVADGYCNSRIVKFGKDGSYMTQLGPDEISSVVGGLSIPHGLSLDDESDVLCIADRENKRVICVRAGLEDPQAFGRPVTALQEPSRARVFDVAFIEGGLLGIGGSSQEGESIGFTADGETGEVVDEWGPYQGFHNPHAIAVTSDQRTVYVGEIGPNRIWKFDVEFPQF